MGPLTYLWAGLYTAGGEEQGKGAYRANLLDGKVTAEGWKPFPSGSRGGSCRSLAFAGLRVLGASHQAGVLWLEDSSKDDATWEAPDIGCGLPLRERARLFERIFSVATDPSGEVLLASGPAGVYRSRDGGLRYDHVSQNEFTERVTIPETWLFSSGDHDITVVSEDEAVRD